MLKLDGRPLVILSPTYLRVKVQVFLRLRLFIAFSLLPG